MYVCMITHIQQLRGVANLRNTCFSNCIVQVCACLHGSSQTGEMWILRHWRTIRFCATISCLGATTRPHRSNDMDLIGCFSFFWHVLWFCGFGVTDPMHLVFDMIGCCCQCRCCVRNQDQAPSIEGMGLSKVVFDWLVSAVMTCMHAWTQS